MAAKKNNREARKIRAQETLDILERGSYPNSQGKHINIDRWQDEALRGTILYKPSDISGVIAEAQALPRASHTSIRVTNETTLKASSKLVNEGHKRVLALNFASAKNPGGGFLNGSLAQEESLATASGLYPTQMSHFEMYEHNRNLRTCLYSDHMIYSPQVPVIRNDAGELLDEPYQLSILTAPAVNAGIVRKREGKKAHLISDTMRRRIQAVLAISRIHNHQTLVLGAWGCGVFQNDPQEIASLFAETLGEEGMFGGMFENIVFAVLDRGRRPLILQAFQNALNA